MLAPSSWNTPIESPPAQQREREGVVEGDPVDVELGTARVPDDLERVADDVEVAQAEEVHLEEAEVLDAVHLVLRDDRGVLGVLAALRLALDREVVGEGLLGDHHRGGVDAVLAAQALEALGHLDHLGGVGVVVAHLPQVGGHLVAVLVLRVRLEAGVQRRVAPHHQRRHGLGHLVADDVGVAEHAGGIAHRGPGLDGGERDDLGDVVAAVPLGRVADHLVPVAGVEVHVDVGHRDAARVEEPLEQQVVLDGVEVGDPERVGHRAAGRAPPPGTHADPVVAGVLDEVPHDEEVRREPHVVDDLELVGQPLHDRVREPCAPPLPGPLHREVAQVVGVGRRSPRGAGRWAAAACRTRSRRRPAPRSTACCRTPRGARRTGAASPAPSSGSARRRGT